MTIQSNLSYKINRVLFELATALRIRPHDEAFAHATANCLDAIASKIIAEDDELREHVDHALSVMTSNADTSEPDVDLLAMQMLRAYGVEFSLNLEVCKDGVEVLALYEGAGIDDEDDPGRWIPIARGHDLSRTIIQACERISAIRKIDPNDPDKTCDILSLELPDADDIN